MRRQAHYGYYRLADEGVYEVWRAIRVMSEERLAEIDRLLGTYLTDRESLEAVCAEELLAKMPTRLYCPGTLASRSPSTESP